ncbi:hypothetical protein N2599_01845 [Rhizobium sullae]|uniref:Uncharacterized protein n=1 Tax=Rhizobium sullae TaxID=50338 RepID=A0A2N0D4C6_RHISU|nr:hypothetical protein [Rhizobium sullae]PKA40960.1 hypothetical protein CWR43_25240 [Rhizobium sullae]UWU14805.1 hypothetical protein N2599_01845 [Rhizobium sullae]
MSTQRTFRKYVSAAAIVAALVVTDGWVAGQSGHVSFIITEAEARVGRPSTPGSVAGVARRTTRRTVRRSAIYVAALPAACVRTSISGVSVWRCGGTYYQSYGGRYVVVYVD